jgi:thioredoxin reductase
VGAGPVGCLAALYAASRGDDVELYELRGGRRNLFMRSPCKGNRFLGDHRTIRTFLY